MSSTPFSPRAPHKRRTLVCAGPVGTAPPFLATRTVFHVYFSPVHELTTELRARKAVLPPPPDSVADSEAARGDEAGVLKLDRLFFGMAIPSTDQGRISTLERDILGSGLAELAGRKGERLAQILDPSRTLSSHASGQFELSKVWS